MYIHYCYCPGNIRRHKKGGKLSTYYIIVFRYGKHLCIMTYTLYTLSMLVPRVQSKEDQVRLVAPTQMALCLRPCLLPTLNPLLCSRHHRQVTLAVKT
jgi:hypothetical protein